MDAYRQARDLAARNPEQFWSQAASLVDWARPPEQVLDDRRAPLYRWYPGGQLNTCANALDRHVAAGRGSKVAIRYDSPVTGVQRSITYAELLDEVAACAGMLAGLGVAKGDRVVIYMAMVPEAIVAMLACARLGAVHSVVFGGFAPAELAARIDDARPRVVVAASCGIEAGRVLPYKPLLDEAIALAQHQPEHCIVLQRPQAQAELGSRDVDWVRAMASAVPHPPVLVEATDPLYILYTSGTTGRPKGVVRDNGGHAVAMAWSFWNVYGMTMNDTWWAASDVGWVVGHSYIVYGPLLHGCTTIVYEGKPVGTPDAGAFWRIIAEHRISALFTAPTAFRAIKKEDPNATYLQKYDIKCLRTLFLAGERADPDTVRWASETLGVPVIDHWWQTETGWPMVANGLGFEALPIKAGSPTLPVPGFDIVVLDASSRVLGTHQQGSLAVRLPLPPGCLPTLWNNDEGFRSAYLREHPGYYSTGDGGYLDEDGYVFVMGRIDDVINVAGHRLSTGELEQALAGHPAVAECAVIGIADELKGTVPIGLVVLKAGVTSSPQDITRELVARVRDEVGPVASFQRCHVVARLPKTRSGKVLRATMRAIADEQPHEVPATIEDPAALEEIRRVLSRSVSR